jgi:hypothetical protein
MGAKFSGPLFQRIAQNWTNSWMSTNPAKSLGQTRISCSFGEYQKATVSCYRRVTALSLLAGIHMIGMQ